MYTLTNEVGVLAIIQQREIFAENGSHYKEKLLVKRQKAVSYTHLDVYKRQEV